MLERTLVLKMINLKSFVKNTRPRRSTTTLRKSSLVFIKIYKLKELPLSMLHNKLLEHLKEVKVELKELHKKKKIRNSALTLANQALLKVTKDNQREEMFQRKKEKAWL